jgi:four helix bundle protein
LIIFDFRLPIFDWESMNEQEFKNRTKRLAVGLIELVESLPKTRTAEVIGRQLLRSGTSIAANYRAACRGRSTADVIAKLRIVEEEADESIYWMELLIEANVYPASGFERLIKETNEILAMTVASIKTLQRRNASLQKIENRKSKIQNG